MIKKKSLSFILILIITLGVGILPIHKATANGLPQEPHNADAMWIEPSEIDLTKAAVGYRFNVTIWLNLSVQCAGWQFKMLYGKAYLNATKAGYTAGAKSNFFQSQTTMPVPPTLDSENDTLNYVLHGEIVLFEPYRGPGYGSLSWVEFELIAKPPGDTEVSDVLDISVNHHPPNSKTYALDTTNTEIPLIVGNCVCKLSTPQGEPHNANAMWIEPSFVNATGNSVGDRFNVTLWLNLTGTNCSAWQFKMLYDKNYLNVTRSVLTGTDGLKSNFFENTGTETFALNPYFDVYNSTHNYVLHGELWLFGPWGTGVGTLSCVEFEIMAEPPEGEEVSTMIDISSSHHPPTSSTYAMDSTPGEIQLNVLDCVYTFKAPPYKVHNLNTSLNYKKIQQAIDAPETVDGHTIFVEEGIYYEHVTVNKSLSLIGQTNNNTILNGNGTDIVVNILVENVSVTNFTIQNGETGIAASGLIGTDEPMMSNISNNIIVSNEYGISAVFSHNDTITNNVIRDNYMGISLAACNSTVLRENELSNNNQNLQVSDYFIQDIDITNTVDGKPIYYWVNQQDKQVPADAGLVAIVNSVNITVQNLDLRNNFAGVLFAYTVNSTIRNVNVSNCNYGIALYASDHNTIASNFVSSGEEGIRLETSDNNIIVNNVMINNTGYVYHAAGVHLIYGSNGNFISANSIFNNYCGIRLTEQGTNESIIYHNNLIDNTYQILSQPSEMPHNTWDNGLEGNYWNNYNGTDNNQDGIGDSWYEIDSNNIDHYPLMGMFSDFNATSEHHVQTICNSTISDFQFNNTAIIFNVTGENGTAGFCRICIPTALMNQIYEVFVNGTEISYNLLPCSNSAYSYLYFSCTHSTQEVIIIPELSPLAFLPLFMILSMLIFVFAKKKLSRKLF